jgi:hypothetical protein
VVSRIEQVFGLRGISPGELFRQGFGFGGRDRSQEVEDDSTRAAESAEQGEARLVQETTHPLPPLDTDDPERNRVLLQAVRDDHLLRIELRNAGLV